MPRPLITRPAIVLMSMLWHTGLMADPALIYGPSLPETQGQPIQTPDSEPKSMLPPTSSVPQVQAVPVKKIPIRRAPPNETVLSDSPVPSLQPETFFYTAKASEHYAAIADAGGWPEIPTPLKPGQSGKMVALLRNRLMIEGDLNSMPVAAPEKWSQDLTEAVRLFQLRHGLKQTGLVAGATLREMNVPALIRFQQLASSAGRLAGLSFPFGERYVVVNLPSASVEAVENGRVTRHYIAVVGDVEHPSPEETARIVAVNLNPTWTLPTSIIKNEIIPKMRQDPHYLSRARIRILDGKGAEVDPTHVNWNTERATLFTLRQDSGAGNSLGNIRIQMPNKDAVYMHDTPSKSQFSGDYRFFSHGCVRVQGVYDFAAWLLEGTPNSDTTAWDVDALKANIATQARLDVKLLKSVPVAWVYLTGWANNDGRVHFRSDVYGLDKTGDPLTDTPKTAKIPAVQTVISEKPEISPSDLFKSIANTLQLQ